MSKSAVILTLLTALLGAMVPPHAAAQSQPASQTPSQTSAQPAPDTLIISMAEAYRKVDRKRLTALLPQAQGHALEPWAAYWELSARLEEATPEEIEAFLNRYAGTYQEDRLRNDWLLLLGRRQDWTRFQVEYPKYRMQDDPQVRCHALHAAYVLEGTDVAAQLADIWLAQLFDPAEGCTNAAARLLRDGKMDPMIAWRRARLSFEFDKPHLAQQAVALINPSWAQGMNLIYAGPKRFLDDKLVAFRPKTREWVTLAMIRLANNDPEAAAAEVSSLLWRAQLTDEERSWIWGVIGKRAARLSSDKALGYYAQGDPQYMHIDHLQWRVRAALRAGDWQQVHDSILLLPASELRNPAWAYWRARALLALQAPNAELRAHALWQSIASPRHFYGQLAMEELGLPITAPAAPPQPEPAEMQAARDHLGLQRALYAIRIGLRDEGVREWNYSISLHSPGGMNDRELLAAAQLACEQQVWDRCISTSDRMRGDVGYAQSFPTPYKEQVQQRAEQTGLDPAFVYGLIRQESRFIAEARSPVGAAGLMQVMPDTARWTARRIGLRSYQAQSLTEHSTNIELGSSYLKFVLDSFDNSLPLAAAAYNAGPTRARGWRGGTKDPVLEAAIWAENIPYSETRDYVKKVLANTVNYAVVLSGEAQSLKARLGYVGPQGLVKPVPSDELP